VRSFIAAIFAIGHRLIMDAIERLNVPVDDLEGHQRWGPDERRRVLGSPVKKPNGARGQQEDVDRSSVSGFRSHCDCAASPCRHQNVPRAPWRVLLAVLWHQLRLHLLAFDSDGGRPFSYRCWTCGATWSGWA
jgi:hypothetical protein